MKPHSFTVPIGAVTYTVKLKKRVLHKGEEVCGVMDCKTRTITVATKKMSAGAIWLAIWHELFHAIFYENGYSEDSKSEAKVEGMAQTIVHLLPALKNGLGA